MDLLVIYLLPCWWPFRQSECFTIYVMLSAMLSLSFELQQDNINRFPGGPTWGFLGTVVIWSSHTYLPRIGCNFVLFCLLLQPPIYLAWPVETGHHHGCLASTQPSSLKPLLAPSYKDTVRDRGGQKIHRRSQVERSDVRTIHWSDTHNIGRSFTFQAPIQSNHIQYANSPT